MKNIKIKICGIKDTKTLQTCSINRVDFFGLIFFKKSPRYININTALELINFKIKFKPNPVGVFVNYQIDDLLHILKVLKLKYIQLHGNEDDDYILKIKKKLNVKIIKSIGLRKNEDLNIIKKYNHNDYFLFDYKPLKYELPGGNAKPFDWSILNSLNTKKPWFISGGISIKNINKALNNLNPYGIDISSGVEDKIGIKSRKKIVEIMKSVNVK